MRSVLRAGREVTHRAFRLPDALDANAARTDAARAEAITFRRVSSKWLMAVRTEVVPQNLLLVGRVGAHTTKDVIATQAAADARHNEFGVGHPVHVDLSSLQTAQGEPGA